MAQDWILAAFTALSVVVSGFAVWYARRANNLVGVYRSAIWTVEVRQDQYSDNVYHVALINDGESPAYDVAFTLDADPLHTLGGSEKFHLIPARGRDTLALQLPLAPGYATTWMGYFVPMIPGIRNATVGWKDLEGKPRTQVVQLPAVVDPPAQPPTAS